MKAQKNDVIKKRVAADHYQPKEQPNFGACFHTQSFAPIRYETRRYVANGLHDLIFVRSYIHDSEFRLDKIQQRGKTVCIPLNRARWELYRETNELRYISSDLKIWPVESIDVELGAPCTLNKNFLRSPKLIISSLESVFANLRNESDDGELVFSCNLYSKLTLRVGDNFRIRLTDQSRSNRKRKT